MRDRSACKYIVSNIPDSAQAQNAGGWCCWRPSNQTGERCRWHTEDYHKQSENFGGKVYRSERFDDAILMDITLRDIEFHDCSLIRTNFQDANIEGAVISNSDLSEANFRNVNAENVSLKESRLHDATLINANFQDASMIEVHLCAADITGADFSNAILRDSYLDKDIVAPDTIFSGCDLSGLYARGGLWNNANFSESDLSDSYLLGSRMKRANLTDAKLTDIKAPAINIKKGSLHRINAANAMFQGIDLYDADLRDATLQGADLSELDFGDLPSDFADHIKKQMSNSGYTNASSLPARLHESTLAGADLRNADLTGAWLTNADLSDADLRNSVFKGANLQNTDLRGADLRGADLTQADIRGATYDPGAFQNATTKGVRGQGLLHNLRLRGILSLIADLVTLLTVREILRDDDHSSTEDEKQKSQDPTTSETDQHTLSEFNRDDDE